MNDEQRESVKAESQDKELERGNCLVRAGFLVGLSHTTRPLTNDDRELIARIARDYQLLCEQHFGEPFPTIDDPPSTT